MKDQSKLLLEGYYKIYPNEGQRNTTHKDIEYEVYYVTIQKNDYPKLYGEYSNFFRIKKVKYKDGSERKTHKWTGCENFVDLQHMNPEWIPEKDVYLEFI